MGEGVTIHVPLIRLNLSPTGFLLWAQDHMRYYHDVPPSHGFSPLPYFLCCRAIELAFKAKHLESMTLSEIKKRFKHHLMNSYLALPPGTYQLMKHEEDLLSQADPLYKSKHFEYFEPMVAMTGFRDFPDLQRLEALADKILANTHVTS